ncbi:major capsid protein [Parazoarcus communis]|uniref:Methyltransferase n=1 Tax=Parazoarcus communis SWub3 = DSM 12120 TaxID=1121029 RepID=A0A323UTH4_9RHOO|nr:major capsid protein [Parazoarcus communis]NMG72539.1 hypothetical protein [Parazoarcus communis SWub3 = DSM 12120]PZA14970.1 hypothetical protein DNK49_19200 [Azoarcus communis] [Parazoarcus communis SWub3 = DSM 12120]
MKQKLARLRALADRRSAQLAVVSPVALFAGAAHAELPASVTTALGDGLTDVGVVGAAVFLIVIAIAVWKYLKRAP